MRLLNVETLQLKSFLNEETRPPYAILSHTWLSDTEEVTFEDLLGYYKAVAQEKLLVATSIPPRARSKKTLPSRVGFKKILPSRARPKKILPSRARSNRIIASRAGFKKILASRAGSKKIQGYCNIVARGRNLKWAWIDTCCIDKRSSAELSEAINSMFKWYRDAKQCYVFLRDVTGSQYDPSFQKSKWFTRGWTLQELIAPKKLSFYNKNWRLIGKMHEDLKLCGVVSSITLIPVAFLRGAPLTDACVAKRMSWASKRQTTRPEDKAYCLLGIFDVNMPLLYGEGSKAFIRLQEEIINHIYDDSILAWGTVNAGTPPLFRQVLDPEAHSSDQGALATSPEDFEDCGDFEKALGFFQAQNNPDFQITTAGVKLGVDIFMGAPYALCELSCFTWRYPSRRIGILLGPENLKQTQFLLSQMQVKYPWQAQFKHFRVVQTQYFRQGRSLWCNGSGWCSVVTPARCGHTITITKGTAPSSQSRRQCLNLILLSYPDSYTYNIEYMHPNFRVEENTHQLRKYPLRILHTHIDSRALTMKLAQIWYFIYALILALFIGLLIHYISDPARNIVLGTILPIYFFLAPIVYLCSTIPMLFRRTWMFMLGESVGPRVDRRIIRARIRITKRRPCSSSSDVEQTMVIVCSTLLEGISVFLLRPESTFHTASVPIECSNNEESDSRVIDQWPRVYKRLKRGGKTYVLHTQTFKAPIGFDDSSNVLVTIKVEGE